MPRAIVATRALRRRVPAPESWDRMPWVVEPLERRKAKVDLVLRWMLFLLAGLLALLALQAFGGAPSPLPREEDVLWLEMPPEPPAETVAKEAVAAVRPPSPVAASAEVPPPAPAEASQPSEDPSPEPPAGVDDAVETGGLEAAVGTASSGSSAPVDAPEAGASAGPVFVSWVPGSARAVVPRYPPRAEALGREAKVVALVTTDTAGNVVDFRIETSGGRDFDESVRRAALSTRFTVPVRDGRPRAVAFRLPYAFRLE